MYEKDDLVDALLEDNSNRRKRQKQLDIRVIVGNPPYSVGQDRSDDNNQNISYPDLDERIRRTYVTKSDATASKAMYDSYIRAIRWASDRIGDRGVIGFVTNAGFVDASTANGLRRCLVDEFSDLYVFHLRGNQRTSGELSRKEGGKVFGSGSRAPIAISLLVKNPAASKKGRLHFHDIGDYLTREEKLKRIESFASVSGISQREGWKQISIDAHGDWLGQRNKNFQNFLAIGDKKGFPSIFENFSQGVLTARDAWCYNFSKEKLEKNIGNTIKFYNSELTRFSSKVGKLNRKEKLSKMAELVQIDPNRISWTRGLRQFLAGGKKLDFDPTALRQSVYRPFTKQWLYFDRRLNEYVYQLPALFPTQDSKNRVIMVKQRWKGEGQLALMVDSIPEFQIDGGTQCFPLFTYSTNKDELESGVSASLFSSSNAGECIRKDGITGLALAHFQQAYPGESITKEDIFYYVYGILHSADYLQEFADNLGKELPRIPLVTSAGDFWQFSRSGRQLADLHVQYEKAALYPAIIDGEGPNLSKDVYTVKKMKYGMQGNGQGNGKDKSTIIYNKYITVRGIPLEAHDYVVNGKSAIDWIVERQSVKLDQPSGIESDANDWAIETAGNPRYPLELLLRVITVSVETMKIVRSLPKLEILEEGNQAANTRTPSSAEPA